MAILTTLDLKGITNRLSEKVGSRGDGALFFDKRKSGTVASR